MHTIIGAGNIEVQVEEVKIYYTAEDGTEYGKAVVDGVEIEVMGYPQMTGMRWLVAE